MSKKILVLSSSPRRLGNSEILCDQFLTGAQEKGHSVEKILLGEQRINYCSGCGACFEGQKACPKKDDMAVLLEKMIAADVIVLATPVYFYTMSAQMKTLIDRCCARYQEIQHKDFYFIVTAADDSKPAMARTIEEFRGFLSCLGGCKEKGVVYGVGAWEKGEIKHSPAMQEAYEFGLNA